VTTVIQSSLSLVLRGLAGDLNGDGNTDLVIYGVNAQYHDARLVEFFGQAGEGFSSSAEYPMASYPETGAALVDLEGTGLPDVAIGGTILGVFSNRGDGTLTGEGLYGPATTGETMATGDFNGDGAPDVATEGLIYYGSRQGGFPVIVNGFGVAVLASGDFNSDSATDLVVTDLSLSSITVYLGVRGGGFQSGLRTPVAHGSPYRATVADFNGDGLQDLLVVTTVDNELLLGRGDGRFLPVAIVLGPSPVAELQAGDLNADGTPDVAVFEINGGGSWTPWFNNCP
jgi:hypothetical protein